ncbi:MAG: RagB/SusD family nutrient uptake outer membrane protein [Prevotella sp.]|nr:RagB/SusD family nutrient uptake outer membrane protein [Prevotella sp.]
MNKIIIPMFALAAGVAFTSCEDKLDIEQKGTISTENFYATDADCEKALASAYEGFMVNTVGRTTVTNGPGIYTPAKVLANHPGDDVNYGGGNYGDHEFGGSIDEFRYDHTPEAINFHYRGLYLSIYNDNLVMHYFPQPATPFQKQAVAEAKVLRAYNFFLLACYWGQPPLVEDLLAPDAIPTNSEMTQKEYFEWVAKQCEEALPDLKERESTTDKEGAYRVTQGFANALAGKAYMFAGKYDEAKAALKRVIDSKKYALVTGDQYLDLFHKEGDGCPEKIFEINMRYNPAAGDWSTGSGLGAYQHSTWMEANCFNWRAGNFKVNPASKYIGGCDGWGSIGVAEWFGEEFHNNDGDSKRFKATLMHIDDAVYQTSGVEGMVYADEAINNMTLEQKKASTEIGISDVSQGLYGQSFYLPFKNIVRAGDLDDGGMHGGNLRLNNIIIMRYAEVLLNYAECCLQTGDNASAKTYINQIQQRAGSKTISDAVDMEVLKREKSYELWFEGCRFQDVLRWNDANAIARLQKAGSAVPHLFDKLFRQPQAGENPVWEHGSEANSRFYIIHTHEAKDANFTVGFQDKHRLFPYPSSIMEMNPNLKQNPGW